MSTYLRPSDLGNAPSINHKLQVRGLQTLTLFRLTYDDGKLESRWWPTKKGMKYAKEVEYDITSHKNGIPTRHRGYTLRWDPKVMRLIA